MRYFNILQAVEYINTLYNTLQYRQLTFNSEGD